MSVRLKYQPRILALMPGTQLFGSERGNIEAYKALRATGAHVVIAISSREAKGGAVGQLLREEGFDTFELPYGGRFDWDQMRHIKSYRKRQLVRLWTNSKLLLRAIKKHRATHIMTGNTLAFLFCGIALTLRRVPLIYRMGDAPEPESRFQIFLWKWLTRRATSLVSISHFIRTKAIENSQKTKFKIHVIHNRAPERKQVYSTKLQSELEGIKRPFHLVYVGQITPQKGIYELIHALVKLNDPKIGCWIVGGSQHTEKIESELKALVKASNSQTNIEFFGFVEDPRPYYAAADWHIAPSKYEEPLGNVVQEAKQFMTPSIISPLGGLPELIKHNINGLVLHDVSPGTISTEIRKLADNPGKWQSYGGAALSSLREELSEDSFIEQWSQVIRQTHKHNHDLRPI